MEEGFNENKGAVLATTINKYCYITCRYLPPFFNHKSRIIYSKMEHVHAVDEIDHPAVREVLKYLKINQGIEIHHDGDLPARTGLGSSSSFTVGLLNSLYALKGKMRTKEQLAKEAIIFTAHLDHIGQQGSVGDTICNGADDDATGVTGVLSLADAYGAMETAPKRTVIFMTFWGEEKGLLGSRYYCANPVWPLEKTVANINLEMLGRPEPGASGKCWSTGWEKSDLSELMSVGAKKVGVLIFQHPTFSGDMLYRASDNAPFVDKGVIAHSFSAGSLHEDYHKPGDEWQKLELKHMTKVIQGLFAGSLPFANGEFTPKKR